MGGELYETLKPFQIIKRRNLKVLCLRGCSGPQETKKGVMKEEGVVKKAESCRSLLKKNKGHRYGPNLAQKKKISS